MYWYVWKWKNISRQRCRWRCWISGRAHSGWGCVWRLPRKGWATSLRRKTCLVGRAICSSNPTLFMKRCPSFFTMTNRFLNPPTLSITSTRPGPAPSCCPLPLTTDQGLVSGPTSLTRRFVNLIYKTLLKLELKTILVHWFINISWYHKTYQFLTQYQIVDSLY